jgi:hypothetical protein
VLLRLTFFIRIRKRTKESIFIPQEALEIAMDLMKVGLLIVLLLAFLVVNKISWRLGSTLDTVPVRIACILMILGSLSYDKYLALGLFIIITALYIHHHNRDVMAILGGGNIRGNYNNDTSDESYSHAMKRLEHGGASDETYDTADFTSKSESQDNEFRAPSHSIDEKHSLDTEHLGTRSERLFPDDSRHVEALEHGNKNGYSD